MKRALVIRTAGDMALATSMLQPLESRELATVREELMKTKAELDKAMAEKYAAENAELGVRRAADNLEYRRKIRRLNRKYPPERKRTKLEDALLVGWAMMWLGIFAAANKLREWNRS